MQASLGETEVHGGYAGKVMVNPRLQVVKIVEIGDSCPSGTYYWNMKGMG